MLVHMLCFFLRRLPRLKFAGNPLQIREELSDETGKFLCFGTEISVWKPSHDRTYLNSKDAANPSICRCFPLVQQLCGDPSRL